MLKGSDFSIPESLEGNLGLRSGSLGGRMPDLPFQRFQNPYKKHWSQVWESGIPTGNLGLMSGRVGC